MGLLTRRLKSESNWRDKYPAWQVYADECEHLLEFLLAKGKLDHYWPRLCSKKQQRDETLNEIRVAYYLDSVGYSVVAWEPVDVPGANVEFSVASNTGGPVLVEVKSPGWEAELSDEERRGGRAKQGFREFQAARRTIQGYEAIHMIRKGQVRWLAGDDLLRQIQFIDSLFDLAA